MFSAVSIGVISLIAFLAILVLFAFMMRMGTGANLRIGPLRLSMTKEFDDIRSRLGAPTDTPEVRQYSLLREYHTQGIAQSRISFWFSVIGASVGFATIIAGAMIALLGGEHDAAALPVLAGAVIETVSALFFAMSNQTRKLMAEFFDKLRADRAFEEALVLARSLPLADETAIRLTCALAMQFSRGSKPDTEILGLVLTGFPLTAEQQLGRQRVANE